jgi:DHA1 family tetracycline resistance protein-like MFS transporter
MNALHTSKFANKYKLWIILGITLLNAIGLTMVFPLFPFLLGKYLPASQIVIGLSVLVSVYAACQFFAAPVFGAMSDRFGRRPVLIASLVGSIIGYIFLGIGGAFWVLLIGRIIDGITAGDITSLFAYITDSTSPKERTKWFSYLGGILGVGTIVGPAIGGLLGGVSITLPFFVTAGIYFIITLVSYFFLPESLSPEKRSKAFTVKHLNVFAHFKEVFKMKEARTLLIIGFFFYVGIGFYQMNVSIFLKDVYSWGPGIIGGILSLIGVCDIVSRTLVLPQLLKRFKVRSIGIFGLSMLALGLAMVGVSAYIISAPLLLAAVICITLGEGFFEPPYDTLLSSTVDDSKQGLLQGASQSLQSGYRAIIPLVAGGIYFFSHSLVYATAAFLVIIGIVLFSRARRNSDLVNISTSDALHVEL